MHAFRLDSVDSTNDAARRLLAEGAIRESAYVLAREQTAGRGTRGRSWSSPREAGIYLSVVHRSEGPGWPVTTAFTRSAAVACVEAIREQTDVAVTIKPVNDLHVLGRKLGGILTETAVSGGSVQHVITGVGINVLNRPRLLDGRGATATSLEESMSAEAFAGLDVDRLTLALVASIDAWHAGVFAGRMQELDEAYRRRVACPEDML